MTRNRPAPHPAWRGVRMRRLGAAADPDAQPRPVTLPAAWEDGAAAALAALVPGGGPAVLAAAAAAWIDPIAAHAPDLEAPLHALLRTRRGAPGVSVWHGRPGAPARFVLNLAAFFDPQSGFDRDGFVQAAATAARALALHTAPSGRPGVGVADLAGLLAALGLVYDSDAARSFAASVMAALRAAIGPAAVPAIAAPDAAEALLGVETGGIAPAFAPLDEAGHLTRAAHAWLAARGLSPAAALAATLAGNPPFPIATTAAHAAMHDAVAPWCDAMPPRPAALPAPAQAAARRELPARHTGLAQRATVGGHRVYLRTGEYADGTPGEITVALPRESAAVRGLMDAFAHAVSLGLQHGVRLEEFVDAFTLTRFGPAGTVEGDPNVARATSLIDYVFRSLAAHYLGRTDLPDAAADEEAPAAPSLPFDLPLDPPVAAPRRGLRLVK